MLQLMCVRECLPILLCLHFVCFIKHTFRFEFFFFTTGSWKKLQILLKLKGKCMKIKVFHENKSAVSLVMKNS